MSLLSGLLLKIESFSFTKKITYNAVSIAFFLVVPRPLRLYRLDLLDREIPVDRLNQVFPVLNAANLNVGIIIGEDFKTLFDRSIRVYPLKQIVHVSTWTGQHDLPFSIGKGAGDFLRDLRF